MTPQPATLRQRKILVVEDEPIISLTIEFAIERMGHSVVGPVARLDEALVVAAGDGFDCAILDVNIQGGLTYSVADLLIARKIPFLLATGYAEKSLPENLKNWPRLVKPYSDHALVERMHRLLDLVDP
jgi:CheY-like chemotaxis protein